LIFCTKSPFQGTEIISQVRFLRITGTVLNIYSTEFCCDLSFKELPQVKC